MNIRTTRIAGLAFNLIVEEFTMSDRTGGLLWYHANILTEEVRGAERRLVRKTRIPGTAMTMARALQANGLRTFDRLRPAA